MDSLETQKPKYFKRKTFFSSSENFIHFIIRVLIWLKKNSGGGFTYYEWFTVQCHSILSKFRIFDLS